MRMANALQSPGLIELNDTEHLGVTDRGKSQPQQYAGREKQSAKDSRNYFKAGPLAIVRLFHRQHRIDSWRYRPLGAFDGSRIPMRPHERGNQAQTHGGRDPFQHKLIVVVRCIPFQPITRIGNSLRCITRPG
jgi:hypothetical protein